VKFTDSTSPLLEFLPFFEMVAIFTFHDELLELVIVDKFRVLIKRAA